MKSRILYHLVTIIKDKPGKLLSVAAKAIYIPPNFPCQSEMVTKSSENPLLLGQLQIIRNFYKITKFVLKNHRIA